MSLYFPKPVLKVHQDHKMPDYIYEQNRNRLIASGVLKSPRSPEERITVSDFASITSHIHNCVLFFLWLHLFILSGVISPLISSSIWAPTDLRSSSFSFLSFCIFILFMGFSRQEYWSGIHSVLQWTTFGQNSPPWPARLGWSYTAWLIVSLT